MAKFTFKTEKPTGKYKSFFPTFYYIKMDGIEVGNIDEDKPHKIRLKQVKKDINEDGNKNCVRKWVKLKKDFDSIEEAKSFILSNTELLSNLNLYQQS